MVPEATLSTPGTASLGCPCLPEHQAFLLARTEGHSAESPEVLEGVVPAQVGAVMAWRTALMFQGPIPGLP